LATAVATNAMNPSPPFTSHSTNASHSPTTTTDFATYFIIAFATIREVEFTYVTAFTTISLRLAQSTISAQFIVCLDVTELNELVWFSLATTNDKMVG
jgi:hypothetical protein